MVSHCSGVWGTYLSIQCYIKFSPCHWELMSCWPEPIYWLILIKSNTEYHVEVTLSYSSAFCSVCVGRIPSWCNAQWVCLGTFLICSLCLSMIFRPPCHLVHLQQHPPVIWCKSQGWKSGLFVAITASKAGICPRLRDFSRLWLIKAGLALFQRWAEGLWFPSLNRVRRLPVLWVSGAA